MVHVCFPEPLSPHSETFKICLSKALQPDSFLLSSRRMRRADSNNIGDQKSQKLTHVHDAFWLPTMTLLGKHKHGAVQSVHRFKRFTHTSEWWPRASACVGLCGSVFSSKRDTGSSWHTGLELTGSYYLSQADDPGSTSAISDTLFSVNWKQVSQYGFIQGHDNSGDLGHNPGEIPSKITQAGKMPASVFST